MRGFLTTTGLLSALACTPKTGSIVIDDTSSQNNHTGGDSPIETGDTAFDDGRIWPGEEWTEGDPETHGVDDKALERLQEYVFRSSHNSQALVVIKDGVLVGEFYSDKRDKDSLVTTWSMAKSLLSALYGVGLREELLDLDQPIGSYISEWSTGPNAEVTIRHLLEMRSGMEANESNPNGIYSDTKDQLAYSLDRTLAWTPGQSFNYVNEDSMVLGEVLSRALGEEFDQIARTELFDPIGMEAVWWKDNANHTLSYCCIDSTARDLARFGLLYARDGVWKGQQLIPSDFVKESTREVGNGTYYGLHWWTFGKVYAALGINGQNLYVYPKKDLVVLRFGNYTKEGKDPIRRGGNWHNTDDSGDMDGNRLYNLVVDLVD